MAIKYNEEESVDVQMTPLIDCVFLLLIFFLVSSQMKKIEKELPIELPMADVSLQVKATPDLVTVGVDKYGKFYINSQPVGAEGLRVALKSAVAENPDRRIRISGDIYAPFRCIVQVMDTCRGEGIDIVGIHTDPGDKYKR
jgi:biopolymer transport protein ExbD